MVTALLATLFTTASAGFGIRALWAGVPGLMGWETRRWSDWPEVIPQKGIDRCVTWTGHACNWRDPSPAGCPTHAVASEVPRPVGYPGRDKGHNLGQSLDLIGIAAREGARLVVFPECALSGYAFSSREEALPVAEPVPGPSTEAIAAACGDLGVYVVVGLLEQAGESLYNAAALVGPEGLVGVHRKAHLPVLGVDRFVDLGDLPPTVHDTGVGRIGMGICYELMFPEHARVLALQGAEIIVLPTNWPEMAEFNPAYLVPARAAENHLWLVAANRVGEERGFSFIGRSRIAGPIGMIVADGKPYEQEILYAEVSLALARNKHLVAIPGEYEVHPFDDRRPEFYGSLVQSAPFSSKT